MQKLTLPQWNQNTHMLTQHRLQESIKEAIEKLENPSFNMTSAQSPGIQTLERLLETCIHIH